MRLPAAVSLFCLAAALGFSVSLDDGKDAFGRQDWKGASTLLGRFLQDHPDDPEAPTAAFLRGVALYQQGDARASLDAFQKLDRSWPQSVYAKRLPYWKGTAALAAGQTALAERELAGQARFPEEEPFTTRALLNLALARVAQKKSTTAIAALEAFTGASTETPLLAQAWAVWADEDRKDGRTEAALAHYRRAWETQPQGRWDLSSRIQAIDLLLGQSRFEEARALLEASAEVYPSEVDRWDDRRIPILRGTGDLAALGLVLEGRYSREKEARIRQELAVNRARVLEEAGTPDAGWWLKASRGPDSTLGLAAILRHGSLLETSGQWGAAAAALEGWLVENKTAPAEVREEAGDRAARDRLLAGDPGSARKGWDRLLVLYPQSLRVPAWLLDRGRVSLEAGDTVSSLMDFSRILKDSPKAREVPEARYQTGLVYLKRQEPARAEAWFYGLVEELKAGDLYQRSLLARGVCFVNSGKTDLARGSLQRLLREAPQGPWAGAAWTALGRNALQARLFGEAAEAYARAEVLASTEADRAQALWSLAEARVGAGDTAAADEAFGRYAEEYTGQERAGEALYRRGAVWFSAKDWDRAVAVWAASAAVLRGSPLVQTREGMAVAHLRAHRPQEGWDQLVLLEEVRPSPDSWYRWGQAATSQGDGEWAGKAFQYLLQTHPDSPAAEAALPRAAGALLGGGKASEALDRYADYFRKFGRQPSSAPVARAAALAAMAYPSTFEALVAATRTWNLAPEVSAEFALASAQSRLDSDSEKARAELEELSRTAPWTSQRSEALGVLGRWLLTRGRLVEARTVLDSAAAQGDDLSIFKARWALAQVTEREGDKTSSARQRESTEKAAGPAVPLEFRLQLLAEAAETWDKAGRADEAKRVRVRIQQLSS